MKKILIGEDEVLIRTGICKIIGDAFENVQIKECHDGFDGYKTITMWDPDIVLTDIRMPGMDGLTMIGKAQAAGTKSKYVILSAYRDFEYARTALRYGVEEYQVKPVNRFELLSCLERLLGSKTAEETKADVLESKDRGSIGRALEYIENHFYQNISLEEVSREIGMNTAYFSTLFKKQTGKKYIDYLTDLRMEKAKNLLDNTDLKISMVAEMVGYGSTKHFARIYKGKFGITPNSNRQSAQTEHKKY